MYELLAHDAKHSSYASIDAAYFAGEQSVPDAPRVSFDGTKNKDTLPYVQTIPQSASSETKKEIVRSSPLMYDANDIPASKPPPDHGRDEHDMQKQLFELQRKQHSMSRQQQHEKDAQRVSMMVGPGIVEMYVQKKRDMIKLIVAACTVALGMSLFWFAKKTFKDIVFPHTVRNEWTSTQQITGTASLPLAIFAAIWTLKVFFPGNK